MKTVLLITLILGAAFATDATLEGIFTQISELSPNNSFGREIAGLLDLSMSQGSQVDEILGLVRDLMNQMKSDQTMEEAEFAQRVGQLTVDILILEYLVEKLNNQLKTSNTQVADLSADLFALGNTYQSLTQQFTLLNGREEDLRNGRQQDKADYNSRSNGNRRVVEALNLILSKLSEAVYAEQGKQKTMLTEVQQGLALRRIKEELGTNHPIVALVSLTTQFDIPTVERVMQRLEALRDSIVTTQTSEDQSEVQSENQFDVILREIVDVRNRLSADAQTTKGLINRRTNDKVIAERNRDQAKRDLPQTEQILINTRNQKEIVESTYYQRKQQRSDELKIVQQAYQIVEAQAERIRARQ